MPENFETIREKLTKQNVLIVAVSKTKPAEEILRLYEKGQRDFGENRVQELKEKQELLPKDIRWHLIGHLQKNKVKYVAEWIHLIHSVDSLALLEEINRQAQKHNRKISCLLQVYIAKEETKFGLSEEELQNVLSSSTYKTLHHIQIEGLMGMATNTENMQVVKKEFEYLQYIFQEIKRKYFSDDATFRHLSMGMSSDYLLAIESGSTMVRIGSLLFGNRN